MNDDYMISFQNETKQTIEASYKKMTAVERSVADFFIGNKDDMDFSSKNISRVLYVSEATLSRFSQKCGYKGYREFIFSYERDLKFEQKSEGTEKDVGLFARRVQNSYQKLLQENFRILDEEQVRRVAGMLNISKRVLIFGIGNSGYAAEEFQLRFMRIGMDVNAVTDSHMMKIGAPLPEAFSHLYKCTIRSSRKRAYSFRLPHCLADGQTDSYVLLLPLRPLLPYRLYFHTKGILRHLPLQCVRSDS